MAEHPPPTLVLRNQRTLPTSEFSGSFYPAQLEILHFTNFGDSDDTSGVVFDAKGLKTPDSIPPLTLYCYTGSEGSESEDVIDVRKTKEGCVPGNRTTTAGCFALRCSSKIGKSDSDCEDERVVKRTEAGQIPCLSQLLTRDSNSLLEQSEDEDNPVNEAGPERDVSVCELANRFNKDSSNTALQGFLFGSQQRLFEYLMEIVSCQNNFGIFITKDLTPKLEKGTWCYRPGQEYIVKKKVHGVEKSPIGVYLCQDKHTKAMFILKRVFKMYHYLGDTNLIRKRLFYTLPFYAIHKVFKNQRRLVGTEFLSKHRQSFLPKIYGVYKEEKMICILQEYIQDNLSSLKTEGWNICKIRKFGEQMLGVLKYLHGFDLVHGDIKLTNLMLRNITEPRSLVIIDFESAKHPQYSFHSGGYTLPYLPQWYTKILELKKFDPLMKTADLWAAACVLISLIQPSVTNDLEGGQELKGPWSQELESIIGKCQGCGQHGKICEKCREHFLVILKDKGARILYLHLGHLMNMHTSDSDWQCLKKVLEYLTDINDVENKTADMALSIITVKDLGDLCAVRALSYRSMSKNERP